MALASNALTTLHNAKVHLGLTDAETDDDDLIEMLINQVSDQIERYCGRTFASTAYTNERFDGTGERSLLLPEFPVTAITRLALGIETGLNVINEASDATRATVTVGSSSITLIITGGANAGSDELTYATYATIGTLAAAVTALGKNWTGTASQAHTSTVTTDLLTRTAYYCHNVSAFLSVPTDPINDYEVYLDRGEIYYRPGFSYGHQNIVVDYTAGYATIPDDLIKATHELVNLAYQMTQRDVTLKREKLGDYEWEAAEGFGASSLNAWLGANVSQYRKHFV